MKKDEIAARKKQAKEFESFVAEQREMFTTDVTEAKREAWAGDDSRGIKKAWGAEDRVKKRDIQASPSFNPQLSHAENGITVN